MLDAPYKQARPGHPEYSVRAIGYPVGALRPNRLAAGMAFTASRSRHALDDEAVQLVVRGTLDKLAGTSLKHSSLTTTKPCPCCGSKQNGKLVLTDAGRLRLRTIRRRLHT